jgi:hypothetical protein
MQYLGLSFIFGCLALQHPGLGRGDSNYAIRCSAQDQLVFLFLFQEYVEVAMDDISVHLRS